MTPRALYAPSWRLESPLISKVAVEEVSATLRYFKSGLRKLGHTQKRSLFEMWRSVAYPTWYSYPSRAKRVMVKLGKYWRRQEEALRKVIEKSVAFCYFHLTSTLARQQPPRLGIK